MAFPATVPKRIPVALLIIGAMVVVGLILGMLYLSRPAPKPAPEAGVSPETKAYVSKLELSDVTMKATENFMKQQLVEVQGKIGNEGPRPLQAVDVYCLFYGLDGHQLYRERVPIVQAKGVPLKPGEVRAFRLPFDSLPGGWNQALPKMVIAQITFAQ